jgi:hypothetical protein
MLKRRMLKRRMLKRRMLKKRMLKRRMLKNIKNKRSYITEGPAAEAYKNLGILVENEDIFYGTIHHYKFKLPNVNSNVKPSIEITSNIIL